jgi:DNA-binding NarL/FixJ family response regulator
MPRMDGLTCLDEIVKRFPEIKVVMLSASTSPELVASALRRGASAYLAKSVDPSDLPSTLRQVLEGNVWSMTEIIDEDDGAGARALALTEREVTILQALARGLSNQEIAKEHWVTQQTVKFHLTNIYRKLGAKNRTQATRIAQQHGLIDSPLFEDGQ